MVRRRNSSSWNIEYKHLRFTNRGLLVVRHYRLRSYSRRAFSVAGPAIWIWLPDSLRDLAISKDSFRRTEDVFIISLRVYIVH